MGDLLDIPGNEISIGEAADRIVSNLRKDREMSTAVEPVKSGTVIHHGNEPMTPMDMLNRAVSQGADINVLEKLMGLQERWEASQARKAFDKAIAGAKSEIAPVVRNATGHNSKRYADMAEIARTVDPILSRYGLSYRFKTSQTDKITVTCILSHEEGHAEETTLSGPSDTSGNKNAIQAIGSTLTYLQRYSLTAALGLAAANDDDGRAAGKSDDDLRKISPEQVKVIRDLLAETDSDVQKFCEIGKIDSVPDMLVSQYESAVGVLNQKKAKMAQKVAS